MCCEIGDGGLLCDFCIGSDVGCENWCGIGDGECVFL